MTVLIKAVEFANGRPCPHAGKFLKEFDFEYAGGRGFGTFTVKREKAKKFSDVGKAFAFWKRQSKTKPFRPDGQPNRPFTGLTIEIAPYDD